MKIVYMGTPQIAAAVLRSVVDLSKKDPRFQVIASFTQPDKPVGRKQILTKPEVKILSEEEGIPVYQPKRIKRERWVDLLKELEPDLILVTAFGQILSREILDIPALGCINLHTSLLPKYRGAAPIQWAIVNGETMTGVTAMKMDAGMDTGDILRVREVAITEDETADTLYEKLSREAASLAVDILTDLSNGVWIPPVKQEEEQATMAPIIKKEDGLIHWADGALSADRKVRGFIGWPGAYTYLQGKKMMLLKTRVLPTAEASEINSRLPESSSVGDGVILSALAVGKHPRLVVRCHDGLVEVVYLQLEGKKPMAAEAFLRGLHEVPSTFDMEG